MPKHRRVNVRSWHVTLILTMFFIAVAGAAGIGWWYARESPAHQGPIILITVEGLSGAQTGPASTPDVTALSAAEPSAAPGPPPLDALMADSVVFERAYTHAPQLLSAHASLLSGRLPFEHGVRDDAGFVLSSDTRTLAEMLRNRGFATGAAVSSFVLRSDTGVSRGFSFFGQPVVDNAATLPSGTLPRESTALAGDLDTPEASPDEATLAAAEQWARKQKGQRYFLMLQVNAAQADEAVSRVSAVLREKRLYDGATVLLVGARGEDDVRLDDATLHVPLWIKQPQREGAGRRIAAPVQHIDLLPTILDLVRAPIPGDLRGRSLRAILGGEEARLPPQPIYSESLAAAFRVGGNPVFALTVNDFRYLRGGSEQLTHLDTPGRAVSGVDVPAVAPDVASMRATLDRLLAGHPLPAAAGILARDRARLARTGYLAGLARATGDANLTIEQQDAVLAAHQQAALLVGAERPVVALRALQSLAREYPTLAAIHLQIGTLASELGRMRDATAAFRAASALRPDAPEMPRALAMLLARTGQTAEAQSQADLAIELARPLGAAEIALSEEVAVRVALAADDVDAALGHADAVQASNPSLPMHAFVQASRLLKASAYSDAVPVLEKAENMLRQHDAALEGLHLALGDALRQLHQLPEAEAAYRRELEAFPQSLIAYNGLVLVLGEAGRDSDIETVIAQMLSAVPTPDGYAAAARLWTTLGHRARAAAIRSDAQTRFRMDSGQARAARVKAQ